MQIEFFKIELEYFCRRFFPYGHIHPAEQAIVICFPFLACLPVGFGASDSPFGDLHIVPRKESPSTWSTCAFPMVRDRLCELHWFVFLAPFDRSHEGLVEGNDPVFQLFGSVVQQEGPFGQHFFDGPQA